jgi:hypothetical protein
MDMQSHPHNNLILNGKSLVNIRIVGGCVV